MLTRADSRTMECGGKRQRHTAFGPGAKAVGAVGKNAPVLKNAASPDSRNSRPPAAQSESGVAATLCHRTPKIARVRCP